MGLVPSKVPLGFSGSVSTPSLAVSGGEKTQVGRTAERKKQGRVIQSNILFYNGTFRDNPSRICVGPRSPSIYSLLLELNKKYSVAPTNLGLNASRLCVLHYITRRSGTTYHSFINWTVRVLSEG